MKYLVKIFILSQSALTVIKYVCIGKHCQWWERETPIFSLSFFVCINPYSPTWQYTYNRPTIKQEDSGTVHNAHTKEKHNTKKEKIIV